MKMQLSKQLTRFYRYERINEILEGIKKQRAYERKHQDWFNRNQLSRNHVIQTNKAYDKWCKRRKQLYSEWKKITDEPIKDFPYIHKEELAEIYKGKENPFDKYYKDDKEDE